jgi:uracil-DNA glycosylase
MKAPHDLHDAEGRGAYPGYHCSRYNDAQTRRLTPTRFDALWRRIAREITAS